MRKFIPTRLSGNGRAGARSARLTCGSGRRARLRCRRWAPGWRRLGCGNRPKDRRAAAGHGGRAWPRPRAGEPPPCSESSDAAARPGPRGRSTSRVGPVGQPTVRSPARCGCRAVRRAILVNPAVRRGRRHAEGRLDHHDAESAGRSIERVDSSPRPSPSAVPPCRKNGTSAPSLRADGEIAPRPARFPQHVSAGERGGRVGAAAAESRLGGNRFVQAHVHVAWIAWAPDRAPEHSAARQTRFGRSDGTPGVRVTSTNGPFLVVNFSVSASAIDWSDVRTSWNPSARRGPTRSVRLTFAGAWRVRRRGA